MIRSSHRLFFGALAAASLTAAAPSGFAQMSATDADIVAGSASFSATGITALPFSSGGAAGTFGSQPCCFGVSGGGNTNAVDNQTGLQGDSESIQFQLASGFGLTGIDFIFSRANPIVLSGFVGNPLASIDVNPAGNITVAWDASTNSVQIFHPWQGGNVSEVTFNNPGASAGQTITLSMFDLGEPGAQAALNRFEWDTATLIVPGDVNGDNVVDLGDFNVIRDNWFNAASPTRDMGDLSGDGIVEFDDFAEWKANYPLPVSANLFAQLTGVPEPSTGILCLAAMAALKAMSRRPRAI